MTGVPVEMHMQLRNLALIALLGIPLALNVGCSENDTSAGGGGSGGDGAGGSGGGSGGDPALGLYAGNLCVDAKQSAASTFCTAVFDAWATWETDQDDVARDAAAQTAGIALGDSWDAA
jgi:hypothetical protein